MIVAMFVTTKNPTMKTLICGPLGQVPQRNAMPATVKLWLSVQSVVPVLGALGPSPNFVQP